MTLYYDYKLVDAIRNAHENTYIVTLFKPKGFRYLSFDSFEHFVKTKSTIKYFFARVSALPVNRKQTW